MTDYEKIFSSIIQDPRYLRNLDWGRPRSGHPEGTIRAHIVELERNLEKLRPKLSDEDYWRLRTLIHTHDTFKPDSRALVGATVSHGLLARKFLAEFCDDVDLLEIVQHHDEPFALWRQFKAKGEFDQQRLKQLIERIADWNLASAFILIDGCTIGKSERSLRWFFGEIAGKTASRFGLAEITTLFAPENQGPGG